MTSKPQRFYVANFDIFTRIFCRLGMDKFFTNHPILSVGDIIYSEGYLNNIAVHQ